VGVSPVGRDDVGDLHNGHAGGMGGSCPRLAVFEGNTAGRIDAQQICQNLRRNPEYADTIVIALLPDDGSQITVDRAQRASSMSSSPGSRCSRCRRALARKGA
jgi:hypothetical protein